MQKLDLHGTKHEDVSRVLIPFIESLWGTHTPVEIITGNSDQMKQLVEVVLKEYKLEYYVGGYLGVKTSVITTEV